MNIELIELTRGTRGTLHEHISSPPALPICFDSSNGVTHPRWANPVDSNTAFTSLDFVLEVNTLAWGQCDEFYPPPHQEEIAVEWNNVKHTVPAILSKWRNYGLFGTNIEGWFTALGVNMFGEPSGLSFGDLQNLDAEVYVVIPTIYAELDHRSCSLLRYETLETE